MSKPVYVIAEIGVNHQGSIELAQKMVDAAKVAGADAAKFQTFITEKILSRTIEKAAYQEANTGSGSQFDMVKELELGFEEHRQLKHYCEQQGIDYLSTAFDFDSLDFLHHDLQLPRLKIASGEITNLPFLLAHARTGSDIILSTGMSNLDEIRTALAVLAFGFINKDKRLPDEQDFMQAYESGVGQGLIQKKVTILHCTSEYPAPFDQVNLNAMATLKQVFGTDIGYSDHTKGIAIPLAATSMGASIIEKHFTLDCSLSGPDHKASLEPSEFADMVKGIRQISAAMGDGVKQASACEQKNMGQVRKVVLAARPIKQGELLTESNLCLKRGRGKALPQHYWQLLDTPAQRDYCTDEAIDF